MALTTPQKAKLAGLAAALTALIALGTREVPNLYHHGVIGGLGDAGLPHAGQGGTMTDLQSSMVEAGATAVTGVTLPAGSTFNEVIGPPTFEIVSTTLTSRGGGEWLEVTVRNKTGTPLQFVGFASFNLPVD